jgi:hypothetical protein
MFFLGALGDVNLGTEDYSNTARWAKLGGVTDAVYKYIGSNATLNLGAQDYTDTSKWVKLGGQNGAFYKYISTAGAVNLGRENYGDTTRWTQVTAGGVSITFHRNCGDPGDLESSQRRHRAGIHRRQFQWRRRGIDERHSHESQRVDRRQFVDERCECFDHRDRHGCHQRESRGVIGGGWWRSDWCRCRDRVFCGEELHRLDAGQREDAGGGASVCDRFESQCDGHLEPGCDGVGVYQC